MHTCHLPFGSGNKEVDGEKCDVNKIKHEASVAKASVVCFTSDFWAYKVDNTQHDTDGEHQIWYHSCQYAEELIQSRLCQCLYSLQIKILSFCQFDILVVLTFTLHCTCTNANHNLQFGIFIMVTSWHIQRFSMLSTLDNTIFNHIHLKSNLKSRPCSAHIHSS